MSAPGLKVAFTEHRLAYKSARFDGWDLTCVCGWAKSALHPATMHPSYSEAELVQAQAAHVRHMLLVHDQQTHSDSNCGRSCIYSRMLEAAHKEDTKT
jgi:hypothetical protein